MFKKILMLLITAIAFSQINKAQEHWYYGNFNHILDDREYTSGFAYNQVILGERIDGGAGIRIDSVQSVSAGLNYMFEYGSDPTALKPVPDIYYKYGIDHFRAYFGSFPRQKLLNFPLALLTDSIDYYRPNIQGGYMEASGDWGYQNAFCDWTGRQTLTVHEAFMAGGSGHINYGLFYFENYFYMYHHAGTLIYDPNGHIEDNGGGAFYIGLDFKGKTIFDKLRLDFGGVGSYDRFRPVRYNHFWGLQGRASIFYKYFGIDASYYKGDKIYLIWGEPFYRCGNYGRLDTYLKLVVTKHVDTKIGWSFHFVNSKTMDNSIQVLISADFLHSRY